MRNKLIPSLAGVAFSFAASGFAFAADMPVKAAPAPPPTPVYNWTGWYVGVNAGASMGNVKTDFNGAPLLWTQFVTSGAPITPGFGFSDTSAPSGFIGGGQIGYNWQYSPVIVVGLEADIQGALERESDNLSSQFTFSGATGRCGVPGVPGVPANVGPCTAATSYTTQIDWFGTVRARIGYVWGNGEVMSYLTGGLAYGEVKINGTNAVSGTFSIPNTGSFSPFSLTQTFGQSHVNTGWVVGYGTEGHLPLMPGNWTWRIEGLYMDLGHLDSTSVTSGRSCANCGSNVVNDLVGGQVTTHSHFTDGILRGGLNYRF